MNNELQSQSSIDFSTIESKIDAARETKVLQFINKKVQVTYSLN